MSKYEKVVAWIPHSCTHIPCIDVADKQVVEDNLILSDLYIDRLFSYLPVKITSDYSRFVVDLERYASDDKEVMSKKGMGMKYNKTINGKSFVRTFGDDSFYFRYYTSRHNLLRQHVENIGDGCLLLDIHSFNNNPLPCDINQDTNRPDLCIGFNEGISNELRERLIKYCGFHNKTIGFNTPFSGSMTVDTSVKYNSFMIEVNKKIYLTNNELNADVYKADYFLRGIIDILVEYCSEERAK